MVYREGRIRNSHISSAHGAFLVSMTPIHGSRLHAIHLVYVNLYSEWPGDKQSRTERGRKRNKNKNPNKRRRKKNPTRVNNPFTLPLKNNLNNNNRTPEILRPRAISGEDRATPQTIQTTLPRLIGSIPTEETRWNALSEETGSTGSS